MTDFLQRLADSALGAAPAVEPLIRPRYAPGVVIEEPVELEAEQRGARTPRRRVPAVAPEELVESAQVESRRPAPAPPPPVAEPEPTAPSPALEGDDRPVAEIAAPPRERRPQPREIPSPPGPPNTADATSPVVAHAEPPVPPPRAPVAAATRKEAASRSPEAELEPVGRPRREMAVRAVPPAPAAAPLEPSMSGDATMRDEAPVRAGAPVRAAEPPRVEAGAGDEGVAMRGEAPARAEVPAADDAAARVEAVVAADDPPRGDVPSRAGLRGSAVPGPVARSVAAPHPPAEPVRVTIGRIEVHAPVPALPEAPAPDWTPPFMSLDDYLARR